MNKELNDANIVFSILNRKYKISFSKMRKVKRYKEIIEQHYKGDEYKFKNDVMTDTLTTLQVLDRYKFDLGKYCTPYVSKADQVKRNNRNRVQGQDWERVIANAVNKSTSRLVSRDDDNKKVDIRTDICNIQAKKHITRNGKLNIDATLLDEMPKFDYQVNVLCHKFTEYQNHDNNSEIAVAEYAVMRFDDFVNLFHGKFKGYYCHISINHETFIRELEENVSCDVLCRKYAKEFDQTVNEIKIYAKYSTKTGEYSHLIEKKNYEL